MTTGTDPLHLMAAYFAGILNEAEVAQLEAWISASTDHADRFARFAIEQRAMESMLRADRDSRLAGLEMSDFALDDRAADRSADLAALAEMEAHAATDPISITERLEAEEAMKRAARQAALDAKKSGQPTGPRVIVIPRPLMWGAIAAVLLLGAWLGMVVLQPDPPAGQPLAEQPSEAQPETFDQGPLLVAQLIAAEDAVWSAGAMPTVDQPVAAGEYRLAEGTARLLFNDGAQVLIESPAFFTLDSAKQMVLHEGRLVGYCNEQARGFVVRTPHAEFTDLGTEFGVVVDPWNQSELHVFKGLVQAQPLTQGDQPVEPIVVSANEAVAASAVEPIRLLDQGADNQRFTATRPIPVSSFNTGQSLRADGSDAHWSITAVDGNVLQQPLPAVLFEPPATPDDRPDLAFLANQPDRLGWVTLDPQYAGLQEGKGKSLTFSTTFDLGRLDPATARLELGFLADNFIAEVRLNGKPIDVPEHAHRPPFVELNRLIIEHGFVAGVNTLEIVVHNDPPTHLTELGLDYLALVGELSVTARLPWQKQ